MERYTRPVARKQTRRRPPSRRASNPVRGLTLSFAALIGLLIFTLVSSAQPGPAVAAPPNAATGLTASGRFNGAFVTWTAPSDNGGSPITNYRVSIYTNATGTTLETGITNPQLVGSAATSLSITGLSSAKGYSFRVEATNDGTTWGAASAPSQFILTTSNLVTAGSNGSYQSGAANQAATLHSFPVVHASPALAGKTIIGFSSQGTSASGGGGGAACVITNEPVTSSSTNLYCWGQNTASGTSGYPGNGTAVANGQATPAMSTGLNNRTVTAVAASNNHYCAVTSESSNNLYCWGLNTNRQLGDTSNTARTSPVKPQLCRISGVENTTTNNCTGGTLSDYFATVRVAQVALGAGSTCVVTEEATNNLYCWGLNTSGMLGDNSAVTRFTPVRPKNASNADYFSGVRVESASIHLTHACATTSVPVAGTSVNAYCWGARTNYQLGDNSNTSTSSVPVALSNSSNWYNSAASIRATSIVAGNINGCLVSSAAADNLYCWGQNSTGLALAGSDTAGADVRVPTAIGLAGKTWTDVTLVKGLNAFGSGVGAYACGVTTETSSNLYCWGNNVNGVIGDGTTTNRGGTPTQASFGALSSLNGLTVPTAATRSVLSNGMYTNTASVLGSAGKLNMFVAGGLLHFAGDGTNILPGMGGLTAPTTYLGSNGVGGPNLVGGALGTTTIVQSDGGSGHTCAVTSEATNNLLCWGANSHGQLGVGDTWTRYSPTRVMGAVGKTITQVAAGDNTTCAITTETTGNMYCWGRNDQYQFAQPNQLSLSSPFQITPFSAMTVRYITVGSGHVCAVTTAATDNAYCWGEGASGENGTTGTTYWVQQLGGSLSGKAVAQIEAGLDHTCALITEGTVHCWGANGSDQLGLGARNASVNATPMPVSLTGIPGTTSDLNGKVVASIAVGLGVTCALATTGTVSCWGLSQNDNATGDNYSCGGCTRTLPAPINTTPGTSSLAGKQVVALASTTSAGNSGSSFCAVASDGTGHCWGHNNVYQGAQGTTAALPVPTAVPSLTGWPGVSAAGVAGNLRGTLSMFRTGPSAPTITSVPAGGPARTLTWSAPTNAGASVISDYRIEYAPGPAGPWVTVVQSQSTATTRTVQVPNANTSYYFRVAAISAEGIGSYSLPAGGLEAPTSVVASARYGSAFVTWTDSLATKTGYRICVYTNAAGDGTSTTATGCTNATGTGNAIYVPAANVVTINATNYAYGYLVTGLSPGTGYTFRVATTGSATVNATATWSSDSDASNVMFPSVNAVATGSNAYGQLGAEPQLPASVNTGTAAGPSWPLRLSHGFMAGKNVSGIAVGFDSDGCVTTTESTNNLYCWGRIPDQSSGLTLTSTPTPPGGLLVGRTVAQVGVATNHACARTTEATNNLYCWGQNWAGPVGDNSTLQKATPVQVSGLTGLTVSSVVVGAGSTANSCAITTEATNNLYCWGDNANYQIADGTTTQSNVPKKISTFSGKTVSRVAVGNGAICAVTTEATNNLYCWGNNANGRTGQNTTAGNTTTPTVVGGALAGKKVTEAALNQTACVTTTEASSNLYCWGRNSTYAVGDNSTSDRSLPVPVGASLNKTWVTVSAAGDSGSANGASCATTSETGTASTSNLFCWGNNSFGETGTGSTSVVGTPTMVPAASTSLAGMTVSNVTTGTQVTCARAVATNGTLGTAHCWGRHGLNTWALGMGTFTSLPTTYALGVGKGQLQAPQGAASRTLRAVSAGGDASCVTTTESASGSNYNFYCFGNNGASTALTFSGAASGVYSQFGPARGMSGAMNGAALSDLVFTQGTVGGSGAANSGCGLQSSATWSYAANNVYCWGFNGQNQLANGNTTTRNQAVLIAGGLSGKTVTKIGAGTNHICAITTDATNNLHCWADNGSGQTGTSTNPTTTPNNVTGGTLSGRRVVAVAGGSAHTCAVTDEAVTATQSNVHCWGSNSLGDLGSGSTGSSTSTPQRVIVSGGSALSGRTAIDIVAGDDFTCVLASDGAVVCWGDNSSGQLGNNTTTLSATPVLVSTSAANPTSSLAGKRVVRLAATGSTACVVASDGTAHCWGSGASLWRGDGTSTNSSVPVGVETFAGDVTAASALDGSASSIRPAATDWSLGRLHTLLQTGPAPSSVSSVTGALTATPTVVVSAPSNPGLAGSVTGYTVQYATSRSGPWYRAAIGGQSASSASTSVPLSGLTPGTPYFFRAAATSAEGTSAYSLPFGGPSAPSGATAAWASGTSATVSWTPPMDTGGSAITSYNVYAYTDAAATQLATGAQLAAATANPQTLSSGGTFTGLVAGETYYFRVAGVNAMGVGDLSEPTGAVVMYTTPAQMAAPVVTAGNGAVTVTFSSVFPGSAAAGYAGLAATPYAVSCSSSNGGAAGSASGTTSPLNVGSLTPGGSYTCTVTVTNDVNLTSPASPASSPAVTVFTAPATPSAPSVVVKADAVGAVTASFGEVTGGSAASGYRALAATPYTIACTSNDAGVSASNTGTASPVVVTALTPGRNYTCTLTVTNAGGLSATSPASSPAVVPYALPSAPTGAAATIAETGITVTWTAPGGSGSAGAGFTSISSYQVTAFADTGGMVAATGMTNPQTLASGATFTGLTPGATYTFRSAAVNSVGVGASSAVSNAVTFYTTPGAPTITSATAGELEVSLAWTAPASNGGESIDDYLVTAYEIVAGIPVPAGAPVSMGSGATTSYTYGSLTKCTTYAFRVAAVNAAGTGASSAQSSSVVPFDEADAPQDLFGLPGESLVVVGWTAPVSDGCTPITSYSVQYRETGAGGWTNLTPGVGTNIKAEIVDLVNGTGYDVQVAAVNAAGTSSFQALSENVEGSWLPTPIAPSGSSPMVTVSATNASVTWSGGVNVSEVLGRYRSPASSGSWNAAPTTVTSPWAISGLTAGSTFDVELYAKTGSCSAPSTCPKVAVQNIQTLVAPTDLAGSYSGGASSLTWTASNNATGYAVYRHTADEVANAPSIGTANTAAYTDTVASEVTLYYWVSATVSGSHWSVESAKTSALPVAMASAPAFSAVTAGGSVLQPTEVVSVGATVQATGGMEAGTITVCVLQAADSSAAESTCGTSNAGDAVTAARWTMAMSGTASFTADAANAGVTSTWGASLSDAPTSEEWTSSSEWTFTADITIGKAARASANNWYVVLIGANNAGSTTTTVGAKSMGTYFELGTVQAINWGTVNPGTVAVTAAYDPNGQPIPEASASANRSRTVGGIWANTTWGLTSSITGFTSAEGWALGVSATDSSIRHNEFAMGCSAEPGGLTLDSGNFLGLTAKNLTGASNRNPLATDSAASVSLDCQLFNGSAKAATYSGTVIIGIGPGASP